MGTNIPYWIAVAVGAAAGVGACIAARRSSTRTATYVGRGISAVLAADALAFVLRPLFEGRWTARGSLPLDLCDVALVIAALACWHPKWQLGVELTYFWGLAGTLQGVLTPDLTASFPQPDFFVFTVAHLGIVIAAVYLVVGLRRQPRRGSVARVFAISAAYTALVGIVDWLTGANYMYLARLPGKVSLLTLLGPWPRYIVSAAGVAVVLFLILDAPFRYAAAHRTPDLTRTDEPPIRAARGRPA